MNSKDLLKSIVALLFTWGESLSSKKIQKITQADKRDIEQALKTADKKLQEIGLIILRKGNLYQLVTDSSTSKIVRKLTKNIQGTKVGRAGMEVLSIICYRRISTKEEIEMIRGISSTRVIRNLLVKGLIKEKGQRGVKKYIPSIEFLKLAGIRRIEDLPSFCEFSEDEKIQSFLS